MKTLEEKLECWLRKSWWLVALSGGVMLVGVSLSLWAMDNETDPVLQWFAKPALTEIFCYLGAGWVILFFAYLIPCTVCLELKKRRSRKMRVTHALSKRG